MLLKEIKIFAHNLFHIFQRDTRRQQRFPISQLLKPSLLFLPNKDCEPISKTLGSQSLRKSHKIEIRHRRNKIIGRGQGSMIRWREMKKRGRRGLDSMWGRQRGGVEWRPEKRGEVTSEWEKWGRRMEQRITDERGKGWLGIWKLTCMDLTQYNWCYRSWGWTGREGGIGGGTDRTRKRSRH